MAYLITLKTPTMQIYCREPLVGGEFTREEWGDWKAGSGQFDKKLQPTFEDQNDEAFRETLLERPFLVCRKFTTGQRAVVFLDNVALIEQITDERARKALEDMQQRIEKMKAQAEAEEKNPPPAGRKVMPASFDPRSRAPLPGIKY